MHPSWVTVALPMECRSHENGERRCQRGRRVWHGRGGSLTSNPCRLFSEPEGSGGQLSGQSWPSWGRQNTCQVGGLHEDILWEGSSRVALKGSFISPLPSPILLSTNLNIPFPGVGLAILQSYPPETITLPTPPAHTTYL